MGTNWHDIAAEAESILKSGEISTVSSAKLQKYIEAVSNLTHGQLAELNKRSVQAQTLNNLLTVRTLTGVDSTINETKETISKLEGTIKTLNKKNSFLSWVVVALAFMSLLATGTQIYLTLNSPPETKPQAKNKVLEIKNNPSNHLK